MTNTGIGLPFKVQYNQESCPDATFKKNGASSYVTVTACYDTAQMLRVWECDSAYRMV